MILLQIHRASNIGERAPHRFRSPYLMSHSIRVVFVLLPLALVAAGCGSSSDPTLPTTPSPTVVTETFAGTVTINGAVTNPFIVGAPSTVTATLTAVSVGDNPATDVPLGMSLGTWNGEYCSIVLANDAAIQGKFIVGVAQTAGSFCLRMFDNGTLTTATSYQVTVTHQ